MELLSCTRRAADGAGTGRAAPVLGAASPRLCHARGSTPCLGIDVILHRRARFCAHTFCAGHSTLRPLSAPLLCVPAWGGLWGDLSHLRRLGAVVSWLSRPGAGAQPRSVDAGATECTPL